MGGDTSSTKYSTDALGNLIGEAPGSPFITNQGDLISTDASGNITITPAISLLGISLPWWAWAGAAIGVLLVVKALVK
ncbi:MAG TPA: hypothetical protein VGL83_08110 [Stellaceae bacterium]|jgi:hypothetical protein